MDSSPDATGLKPEREGQTRPYEIVHSIALALGKVGSRVPDERPQHTDAARRTLWWSISWGNTGRLRPDLELQTELAWMNAMLNIVDDEESKQSLAADIQALEWVLGWQETPISD